VLGHGTRDVDTVDQDPARRRIVEAQQQLERRALAGAGGADESDGLTGLDRQREIVERRVLRPRRIAKPHVLELDPAPARLR
jgi:hypothetical protein